MRMWTLLRRRIHWIILAAVLFLLYFQYEKSSARSQINIPVLKKSFVRRGQYILLGPFQSQGHKLSLDHSMTLVTHTSLKNLFKLQVVHLVWKSPISVSIWANGDITKLVELCYIMTMSCNQYDSLTLSILIPADQTYSVDITSINWSLIFNPGKELCSQRGIHNRLYELRSLDHNQNYATTKIPYPNNFLRNIALSYVATSHVIVVDIDLLPSVNMDDTLVQYFHDIQLPNKTALVVPVFESQQSQSNQWNIDRLLKEWNNGKLRQFYVETCPQCQGPTQYTNWLDRQANSAVSINDPVAVPYKPGWEPFIILKTKDHPRYDERFKQFGYNRMSLICELHMSGYRFQVLNKVFLVHAGLKQEEGFHADKDAELAKNEKLYLQFRDELAAKLNTKRTC